MWSRAPPRGNITVTFHNGTTATAKVVGTSESNDLAVIKVDGVGDLNPATFAKSSELRWARLWSPPARRWGSRSR